MTYSCPNISVSVCTCVRVCVWGGVCVCVCMSVCMCVSLCGCPRTHDLSSEYWPHSNTVSEWVCVGGRAHARACMSMLACMFVCVCVCHLPAVPLPTTSVVSIGRIPTLHLPIGVKVAVMQGFRWPIYSRWWASTLWGRGSSLTLAAHTPSSVWAWSDFNTLILPRHFLPKNKNK